jgi:hypothetical protein
MVDTFRSEQAHRPFDLEFFAYLMDGMVDRQTCHRRAAPERCACDRFLRCNDIHQFDLVDNPFAPIFDL